MRDWLEQQIRAGQFSDASDYVLDLIRQDQEFQDKRKSLLEALDVGEASGISEHTLHEIWTAVKARHSRDV